MSLDMFPQAVIDAIIAEHDRPKTPEGRYIGLDRRKPWENPVVDPEPRFEVSGANREWTGADYQVRMPDGHWQAFPTAISFDDAADQARKAWAAGNAQADAMANCLFRIVTDAPKPEPVRVADTAFEVDGCPCPVRRMRQAEVASIVTESLLGSSTFAADFEAPRAYHENRAGVIAKALADRMSIVEPEPEAPARGWYAGLDLDRLSVGPFPTAGAALEAARAEHNTGDAIYLVEAEPATVDVAPFTYWPISAEVLTAIDESAALIGGVLPPLSERHKRDLTDRLNRATREWMAAHGIRIITRALANGRNAVRVAGAR